jgi:hypothetical protein
MTAIATPPPFQVQEPAWRGVFLKAARRLATISAAATLLVCGSANAAALVLYPFNDNTASNGGKDYTTFNSAVLSSSTLTQGAGLGNFTVGTDSIPPTPTVQVLKTAPGTAVSGATSTDALSNNWYFQFTLTPNATMDIRSIEADWSRGGTTGTRGWFVRSSLDNFASNLYSNETPDGTAKGLQHAAFDISGFVGLSTSVDFRFYIYTDTSGRNMDFQNIQFNDTSVSSGVPAPSTAAMLCLGLACGGYFRARRRQLA